MKKLIFAIVTFTYIIFGYSAFSQENPSAPENVPAAPAPAPGANVAVPASPDIGSAPSEDAKLSEDGGSVKLWKHGTLMLDPKHVEWVYLASKSHKEKIPLEILIPDLFPPAGTPVIDTKNEEKQPGMPPSTTIEPIKEAPVFYLKTILYFAKDHWSLWLNNMKFNAKEEQKNTSNYNITIIKVARGEALFLWKQTQISIINPGWKDDLISLDGVTYASQRRNIVVNSVSGDIAFLLKPNQTLVSRPLSIVEGKSSIVPVDKSNTSANGEAGNAVIEYKKSPEDSGNNKAIEYTEETLKKFQMLKSILEDNVKN